MLKINRRYLPASRLAVSLIFSLIGFMYANLMARLPLLQEMYDLDNGALSLVLLSISIGSLVSMPITGRIIVQTGSRQLTLWGCVVFICCYPLLLLTGYYWGLLVFAFLMGMSSGTVDIAMNAQAVLVEGRIGRPAMSSFHALFSAGMMLGAAAGALFTRLEVPLLYHLLSAAAISLATLPWAMRYLIADRPDKASLSGSDQPKWRFRNDLVILGLIAFCCMLGEGAMADWSTNYLVNETAATAFLAPFGLAAFSTAMMVGRFGGDRVRARLGDYKLMRWGALVAFGGLLIVLAPGSAAVSIIGFFLVGIGLATIVPIAYSRAGTTAGMPAGMGISIVSAIGYSGFLIGPPVIGFIGDALGLRTGLIFVLFLFALMFFLSIRIRPRVTNPLTK